MTTWLVTGGAGFIGGNFVLEAVARGVKVVNLDALTYAGNRDTLASLDGDPNHVFVHGDIGDRDLVAKLLAEHRPDAVLNFAAESHVDRSIDGPAAFIQTNVVGTLALLEAVRDHWKSLQGEAKDSFRFLHVSTDEVYGSLGETGKFTEETPYAPNSPYSASKAASDHLVRAFHHTYGLPVLNWEKSEKAPASAKLALVLEKGAAQLKQLALQGPKLDVQVSGTFASGLQPRSRPKPR